MGSFDPAIAAASLGIIFFIMVTSAGCIAAIAQHRAPYPVPTTRATSRPAATTSTGAVNAATAVLTFTHSALAHGEELEYGVCLQAEFKDGERGRILPRCCHKFHDECIERH